MDTLIAAGTGAEWSSSFVWARNYKTHGRYATSALLAGTVVPVRRNNLLTGRAEWSQRDELFEYDHDLAAELRNRTGKRAFPVGAYTVGYTRELGAAGAVSPAVGVNLTAYTMDRELRPFYGSRPVGVSVFLRFRLRAAE